MPCRVPVTVFAAHPVLKDCPPWPDPEQKAKLTGADSGDALAAGRQPPADKSVNKVAVWADTEAVL